MNQPIGFKIVDLARFLVNRNNDPTVNLLKNAAGLEHCNKLSDFTPGIADCGNIFTGEILSKAGIDTTTDRYPKYKWDGFINVINKSNGF